MFENLGFLGLGAYAASRPGGQGTRRVDQQNQTQETASLMLANALASRTAPPMRYL